MENIRVEGCGDEELWAYGCSNVLSKSVSLEQAPSLKVKRSSKKSQTFTGRRMAAWNKPNIHKRFNRLATSC